MKTLDASAKRNSDEEYYMRIITPPHQVVHEGKMNTISYTKEDVADAGDLKVLVVASANEDVHLRIAFNGEGKTRIKTYSGSVVDVQGTEKTPFNRQVGLASTFNGSVYIDSTFTDLGTLRGNDFLGTGGIAPQRAGGTGNSDIETIVNAGTTLLIQVVNASGTASDLGLILNMYERNKIA